MALTGRECPDCKRRVKQPFRTTVTGRAVCPDCAEALALGTATAVTTGNAGSGYGVLAMLMRRIRRTPGD